jgi:hypothetical protein
MSTEPSIFALLGLLCITLYTRFFEPHRPASIHHYILIGSLLGILNLTRGDGVFVSFAIIGVECLLLIRYPVQRRIRFMRLSTLIAVTGGISFILVLWSQYADGIPLPANQSGRRFIAMQSVLDEQYQVIPHLYAQKVVTNFSSLSKLIAGTIGTGILAILAVGWPLQHHDRILRLIVLLYVVSFFLFLGLYQHYFPDVHGLRYMVFPGYLLTIFLVRALDHLITRTRFIQRKNGAYSVAIAGLLLLSLWHYHGASAGLPVIPTNGDHTWRMQLNRWVNENLPPGTSLAAKDHGQLAYFTDVKVVDLAGIIQPELVHALKRGQLPEFLSENEVEYILLNDTLNHRVFREIYATLDLQQPVLQIREPGARDAWELYRLRP